MTIAEFLQHKYSPGTAKAYQREIEIYLKANPKASESSFKDVMEYIGTQRNKYGSSASIHRIVSSIKVYYQYLNHIGQRKDNPARSIKLRDKRHKALQVQDLFTTKELELLLERKERYADLQIRNQVVISLLIYQGLTTGEMASLTLEDINLEEGTIKIKATPKTNAREQKLKTKQIMLLHKYISEVRTKLLSTNTDKLIITKLGTAETGEGIHYLVSTYKKLFPDRNLNPKTIRMSVITNILKEGKDLRIVQAFAGHKYPSATERYKQRGIEELKQVIQKLHPLQ
jgi:integrase/recombinase XerD